MRRVRYLLVGALTLTATFAVAVASPSHAGTQTTEFTTGMHLTASFPYGLVQGEPTIRSDSAGQLYVMAPGTTPIGCELWVLPPGGRSFQFHTPPDLGVGGGDCDLAVDPAVAGKLAYSSLSLANITVGSSTDGAQTFSTPNPIGSPVSLDDRQWMATDGSRTYLTTHFVASDNIGVLLSTDGGQTYQLAGLAIDPAHIAQAAYNNELGPIVVDTGSSANPKPIYTIFTAPSTAAANVNSVVGTAQNANNAVYLAQSQDGGLSWVDTPIWVGPTSETYDHIFPALGIDAGGNLWAAFSDDAHVYMAHAGTRDATLPSSSLLDTALDPGALLTGETLQPATATGLQWTVPVQVDTTNSTTVFPWIVGGGDHRAALVWYGGTASSPNDLSNQWTVHYAHLQSRNNGLAVTQAVASDHVIHQGAICETGVTCSVNGDRTLLDFFTDTVTPDGRVAIAWADDSQSPGVGQIYTTVLCAGTNVLTGASLTNTC